MKQKSFRTESYIAPVPRLTTRGLRSKIYTAVYLNGLHSIKPSLRDSGGEEEKIRTPAGLLTCSAVSLCRPPHSRIFIPLFTASC